MVEETKQEEVVEEKMEEKTEKVEEKEEVAEATEEKKPVEDGKLYEEIVLGEGITAEIESDVFDFEERE